VYTITMNQNSNVPIAPVDEEVAEQPVKPTKTQKACVTLLPRSDGGDATAARSSLRFYRRHRTVAAAVAAVVILVAAVVTATLMILQPWTAHSTISGPSVSTTYVNNKNGTSLSCVTATLLDWTPQGGKTTTSTSKILILDDAQVSRSARFQSSDHDEYADGVVSASNSVDDKNAYELVSRTYRNGTVELYIGQIRYDWKEGNVLLIHTVAAAANNGTGSVDNNNVTQIQADISMIIGGDGIVDQVAAFVRSNPNVESFVEECVPS
jgi:hypothetical protein